MVSPRARSRPLLIDPSALSPIEYEAYSILVNHEHHRPGRLEEPEQQGAEQISRFGTSTTPSGVWQVLKRWIKVDVDPKVEKQILSFYREPSATQTDSSDGEGAPLHLMLGMLRLWSHSSTNRVLTRDLAFIQNDEPAQLFVPAPSTKISSVEQNSSSSPTSPPIATASSNPFRITPVASPSPPPHPAAAAKTVEQDITTPSLVPVPVGSASRGPPPSLPAKRIVSESGVASAKRETNPFRSSASPSTSTTVTPRAVPNQPKDAATSSTIPFPPSLPPRRPAVVSPIEPPPRRVSLKKTADSPSKPRVSSLSMTHRPGGAAPNPPPTHRATSSTPTMSSRTPHISTSGYNPLSDTSSPVEPLIKTRNSSSSSKLTGSTHIGLESSVRLLPTTDESPHRLTTRMARSNSAISNASSTTSNPDVVGTYDGRIVYERPFPRKVSSPKTAYSTSRGMGITSKDLAVEGMELEASSSDDVDDEDELDRATVLTDPLPTRSRFESFSKGETIRPDQLRNQAPLQPPPRRVITAPSSFPFFNLDDKDDDQDIPSGWGASASTLARSATHSGASTSRRRSDLPKGVVRPIPQRANSLSVGVQRRKGLGGNEAPGSWTQAAREGEEWMNRAKEGIVRRTSRGIDLIITTTGSSKRERGEPLVGAGTDDDEEEEGVFRDQPEIGRVVASEGEEDSDDDDGGRVEPEPPERVKRKTAEEVRREVEREVKKSQEILGAEWE
ncbi:BZ3500_MvSof-1268-A1-R1_Chr6-2g08500 [Microbotryum saponariae]|uniref:BZ3500_MvSof-1268-A1-R1_Chr6-2g08500 protein n=1 Tax=Microbotryum saponariae TaxID=289078 RepID=A0A2X0NPP6_9BASI|nr:BZ3500_MvSof-1268-A1-R1_Chr6-2g08500 [Microbotryum saponariae]SDA07777.1 BZ3501_MvSof-1269-A2-R1_Chr6-1g08214 [Microbotryum saponariae]